MLIFRELNEGGCLDLGRSNLAEQKPRDGTRFLVAKFYQLVFGNSNNSYLYSIFGQISCLPYKLIHFFLPSTAGKVGQLQCFGQARFEKEDKKSRVR